MTYRIENNKDLGIILWAEAPCGMKQPLVMWNNLQEMKRFAHGLLRHYDSQAPQLGTCSQEGKGEVEQKTSVDELLRQALGENEQSGQNS